MTQILDFFIVLQFPETGLFFLFLFFPQYLLFKLGYFYLSSFKFSGSSLYSPQFISISLLSPTSEFFISYIFKLYWNIIDT